jgi:hypothetical protein
MCTLRAEIDLINCVGILGPALRWLRNHFTIVP